jgi:hypothetical protein
MEDRPTGNPRIVEALEACRPGSEDLYDPSLAFLVAELAAHPQLDQLYERLQRLDAKLARAYRDVPVPEGLARRIVARLEAARTEPAASETTEVPNVVACDTQTAVDRPRVRGRIWIIAATAAVILVALSAFVLRPPRPLEVTEGEAIQAALERFAVDKDDREQDMASPRLISRYPFSGEVLRFANTARQISDFLGQEGVAYDMAAPDGTRATLYVVGGIRSAMPSVPPIPPTVFTARRSASAWQSQGLLYVLVVDGGPQKYRQFLDIARGPIT